MVKVIINPDDDKVIGMHIVSKDAGEIMQGFGAAMKCGVTKQQIFDTVSNHSRMCTHAAGSCSALVSSPLRNSYSC